MSKEQDTPKDSNPTKTESIYNVYGTDSNKEVDGVWIPGAGGTQFLLARAGGSNQKFKSLMARKMRPHRRSFDRGFLDNEVANEVLLRVFSRTVLLGWKGVFDQNGKRISFTIENAENLMRALPDLFRELYDASSDQSNFSNLESEEIAKN